MALQRGLVISGRFTFEGGGLRFPGSVAPTADELRRYVLYWDRLDWPSNNMIYVESSADAKFLESAGILSRMNVTATSSGDIGLFYVLAQFAAFQELNRREPGAWTIGQDTAQFFAPRNLSEPTRAVEVELYNALPIPSESVALADVLEFKAKRSAELLALRTALDALYLRISESVDAPRAKDAAVNTLQTALRDLNKLATESWGTRLLKSVKIDVRLSSAAAGAATGVAVAAVANVPLQLGTAIGAGLASLKWEPRTLLAPAIPERLRDFAYIFNAQRELKAR